MAANPFPLNIVEKQDSWDKLQLLQYLDPSLKITAAELNKITQALEFLYRNISVSEYSGNIPLKLKPVIIDYNAEGSTVFKVKTAINNLPNYPLADGYSQWFYTHRLVLTNGEGVNDGAPGTPNYAVITEYFLLAKKIAPIDGVASVGVDGTSIEISDLVVLPPKDSRNFAPQEFDLGNIGSTAIWTSASSSGPRSTPNAATIVFKAVQNSVSKAWLYLGGQENVGIGYPAVETSDFRLLPPDGEDADPLPSPEYRLWKTYTDIDDMLNRRSEQSGNEILKVVDASADENITFLDGETNKQAFYSLEGESDTGTIVDYGLMSAPSAQKNVKPDWTAGDGTPQEILNKPNQTNFSIYNQNKTNKVTLSTTTKTSVITATTGVKSLPSYNLNDSFIGRFFGTFDGGGVSRTVTFSFIIGNKEFSKLVTLTSTGIVPVRLDFIINFPVAREASITGVISIGSVSEVLDLDFTIITGFAFDIQVELTGGTLIANSSILHRHYN